MTDFNPYLEWIDGQYNNMCKSLFKLADISSGSFNMRGLSQMERQLTVMCEALWGNVEVIPLPPVKIVNAKGQLEEKELGNILRVTKRKDAPLQILLVGHMDTVFSEDDMFHECVYLDDNRLSGPGVADIKGGIVVMLKALEAFERSPLAGKIGWEVFINPDEEIGSPGSAKFLAKSAERCDVGMVFEPALPGGKLAGRRKGSGNFTAVVRGKSSHAGRDIKSGRNAIKYLSEFTISIDALNDQKEGVTINPGHISGGGPVNIVPDLAMLKFNIRTYDPDDEKWVMDRIHRVINNINSEVNDLNIELHGEFLRKPKLINPATLCLFREVEKCGKEMGIDIDWEQTGGSCDGNNLSLSGLPNVDTLGVRGENIHSAKEFIYLDSLVERTKLSTFLLMKLASDPAQWKRTRDIRKNLYEQYV